MDRRRPGQCPGRRSTPTEGLPRRRTVKEGRPRRTPAQERPRRPNQGKPGPVDGLDRRRDGQRSRDGGDCARRIARRARIARRGHAHDGREPDDSGHAHGPRDVSRQVATARPNGSRIDRHPPGADVHHREGLRRRHRRRRLEEPLGDLVGRDRIADDGRERLALDRRRDRRPRLQKRPRALGGRHGRALVGRHRRRLLGGRDRFARLRVRMPAGAGPLESFSRRHRMKLGGSERLSQVCGQRHGKRVMGNESSFSWRTRPACRESRSRRLLWPSTRRCIADRTRPRFGWQERGTSREPPSKFGEQPSRELARC